MPLNTNPITIKALKPLLRLCWEEGESIMLHSAPGVGKTTLINDFAKEIGGPCISLPLTQIDATDLRGMLVPDLKGGVSRYLPPEVLPQGEGPGVIFLDEIDRADPFLRSAAFSLLAERRVGDVHIQPGWLIAAAGNGADFSTEVLDLDPALADRLEHFKLKADADSFIEYGLKKGFAPEVLTLIRTRPDLLERCEYAMTNKLVIFETPRSWEKVSNFLKRTRNPEEFVPLVQGRVGNESTAELVMIMEDLAEQADVYAIMKSSEEERIKLLPSTVAGLFRLGFGLVGYVTDLKTAEEALKVIMLLPHLNEKHPDLPTFENMSVTAERLFQKATDLKFDSALCRTEAFDAYTRFREENKLQNAA